MQTHSHQCKLAFIKKKEKLINQVVHKDKSVHRAAKTLGIKYSTAKAIVKRFKDTGVLSAKMKAPEERPLAITEESSSPKEPSYVIQNHQQLVFPPEYNPLSHYSYPGPDWMPYQPSPYAMPYQPHPSMMPYPPMMNPFWMPF